MPSRPVPKSPLTHRLAVAALLLAAPVLVQCAGDDLARIVPAGMVSTSSRDAERAAEMISAYRRARGLGPVSADSQLNAAAIHQARAVAEAGRLSHGDFSARMAEHRIGGAAAENLTAGSEDVSGALARWKASPAHDRNLLMREARRIGLARADSPGHGYKRYCALVLAQ